MGLLNPLLTQTMTHFGLKQLLLTNMNIGLQEVAMNWKVFVLVPRSEIPCGHQPLKGKLVCKHKCDDTGKIVQYKVRYITKGFAQRYSIDYNKTTSPTVQLESLCSILHIATFLNWDLCLFDIKTAFLHGILPETETMFMEQPAGFQVLGKEDWVMKLMKSMYSTKQAGQIWNQTFHKAVTQWGFERIPCEWCIYWCIEWALYWSLVGSLMYISVATQPDISYAISQLSSFLDCYRPKHWNATTWVLQYLKGTHLHALMLGGNNPITLSDHSDSDYTNCVDTS